MARTAATPRGPFATRLKRHPGKGGWMFVEVPRKLTPPITRAWARTPVEAVVDGNAWTTSIWRAKTGTGFLPVPKRIRGEKGEGAHVTVAFTFVDD